MSDWTHRMASEACEIMNSVWVWKEIGMDVLDLRHRAEIRHHRHVQDLRKEGRLGIVLPFIYIKIHTQ